MDGFQAFKYYVALKLHFNEDKFSVFVNRGRVRGSRDTFSTRNDRRLFEKMSRLYTDKEFVHYVASNFMYGHPNMIYEEEQAVDNYMTFKKRRQSMTRVFENDLCTIKNSADQRASRRLLYDNVLQLALSEKITVETFVILNESQHLVQYLKENQPGLTRLCESDVRRFDKSSGFVKYDPTKVSKVFAQFQEDIQTT